MSEFKMIELASLIQSCFHSIMLSFNHFSFPCNLFYKAIVILI